jgi:hypothetical protein
MSIVVVFLLTHATWAHNGITQVVRSTDEVPLSVVKTLRTHVGGQVVTEIVEICYEGVPIAYEIGDAGGGRGQQILIRPDGEVVLSARHGSTTGVAAQRPGKKHKASYTRAATTVKGHEVRERRVAVVEVPSIVSETFRRRLQLDDDDVVDEIRYAGHVVLYAAAASEEHRLWAPGATDDEFEDDDSDSESEDSESESDDSESDDDSDSESDDSESDDDDSESEGDDSDSDDDDSDSESDDSDSESDDSDSDDDDSESESDDSDSESDDSESDDEDSSDDRRWRQAKLYIAPDGFSAVRHGRIGERSVQGAPEFLLPRPVAEALGDDATDASWREIRYCSIPIMYEARFGRGSDARTIELSPQGERVGRHASWRRVIEEREIDGDSLPPAVTEAVLRRCSVCRITEADEIRYEGVVVLYEVEVVSDRERERDLLVYPGGTMATR